MSRSLILFLGLLLAGTAVAQDATALKAALAPGKQIFISRQMELSPAEQADFWPIYDQHQAALAELANRRRAALAAAAGAQGDAASDAAEELVEIDVAEAELVQRTWERVADVLPADKALRYLALEQQVGALQRQEATAAWPPLR